MDGPGKTRRGDRGLVGREGASRSQRKEIVFDGRPTESVRDVYPIPASEGIANANLTQYTGYERLRCRPDSVSGQPGGAFEEWASWYCSSFVQRRSRAFMLHEACSATLGPNRQGYPQ